MPAAASFARPVVGDPVGGPGRRQHGTHLDARANPAPRSAATMSSRIAVHGRAPRVGRRDRDDAPPSPLSRTSRRMPRSASVTIGSSGSVTVAATTAAAAAARSPHTARAVDRASPCISARIAASAGPVHAVPARAAAPRRRRRGGGRERRGRQDLGQHRVELRAQRRRVDRDAGRARRSSISCGRNSSPISGHTASTAACIRRVRQRRCRRRGGPPTAPRTPGGRSPP